MPANERTIQTFPSGQSFHLKSYTTFADREALLVRTDYLKAWRKPKDDEFVAITRELRAESLLAHDVLVNDTALVHKLCAGGCGPELDDAFDLDAADNYPTPENPGVVFDALDDVEPEILEWWRITQRLADKLKTLGEVVLDNEYGTWWGRQTSGQAILLDNVLQRVADAEEGR